MVWKSSIEKIKKYHLIFLHVYSEFDVNTCPRETFEVVYKDNLCNKLVSRVSFSIYF